MAHVFLDQKPNSQTQHRTETPITLTLMRGIVFYIPIQVPLRKVTPTSYFLKPELCNVPGKLRRSKDNGANVARQNLHPKRSVQVIPECLGPFRSGV